MCGKALAAKGRRLFIGLMSGTSVDGIDAALVSIGKSGRSRYQVSVLSHVECPWPKNLRERLLAAMAPAVLPTAELCALNVQVAEAFARAVERLLAESGARAADIHAIGSHGQTICHLPPRLALRLRKNAGSTLQLGDVSVLATLTGITTVGNFRAADMAVGGQGAPLVPWTDDMLLAADGKTRCVQNIGGIANVTCLPPRNLRDKSAWTFYTPFNESTQTFLDRPPVIAFDTGPGNMLLDAVVSLATQGKQRFDRNGRMAATGNLDSALFRELQKHPYFRRRPPKSTGREEFGAAFAADLLGTSRRQRTRLENLVHTLTRLTAWSIVDAYQKFLPRWPDEVILCGGGADNPMLVAMLKDELASAALGAAQRSLPKLRRIDEFGIPNKAKEATSFALLAAASLDRIPANIPEVTGAQRPVVLGVVARP